MMDPETNSKILDRIMECDANEQYELNISKLNLEIIPAEIMQVPRIKVLIAVKNRISSVPAMSTFTMLQKLDLSRNELVSINEYRLSGLHALKILDVSRNRLELLPEDICHLPLLTTLLVHRNKLKKIPDSIGELKTLMHIDASHNCLTVIGDKLDGLSLLQTLNLAFNEDLDETTMSEKCKRHLSMREILTKKSERRALVKRCLGVDHAVVVKIHNEITVQPLMAEEERILNELNQEDQDSLSSKA